MTDIEQMRSFVSDLYPGSRWTKRVKNMSDPQVMAIYLREYDNHNGNKNEPKEENGNDDIPF